MLIGSSVCRARLVVGKQPGYTYGRRPGYRRSTSEPLGVRDGESTATSDAESLSDAELERAPAPGDRVVSQAAGITKVKRIKYSPPKWWAGDIPFVSPREVAQCYLSELFKRLKEVLHLYDVYVSSV